MHRLPKEHLTGLIPPGYDQLANREIHLAHTEDGRTTKGVSEFNVKLAFWNRGVLLRRKLDYSYPNQRAAVYVASINPGKNEKELKWQYAGEWYLAGSNTYVFSRPAGELDPRQYNILTSHRLFRDDEFMIPERLTRNQSAIRIRIQFLRETKNYFPVSLFPKKVNGVS